MHIISKRPFVEAARKFPNDADSILVTHKVLEKGQFKTPDALRAVFPSLDNFKYKDKWWVIDIGGNNLRLLMAVQFVCQRIYVKFIVSHSEYNKLTEKAKRGRL
ncbi:MAG: type II toxin-antitoxin system HigB family toxin [Mariprofundus sp.]|nr:type II toxin-antitoxin system HigB family toxin [Mariprofundus sp.]